MPNSENRSASGAASRDTREGAADDAPAVTYLQKMLQQAVGLRASDLHFEPFEFEYRIRFRIDGELQDIASAPLTLKERLASRIKILSRLDISEKRVPQDGRMKIAMAQGQFIDFRVSTLPTLFGEKIVIRILDPAAARMGLEALGLEAEEKEGGVNNQVQHPSGKVPSWANITNNSQLKSAQRSC